MKKESKEKKTKEKRVHLYLYIHIALHNNRIFKDYEHPNFIKALSDFLLIATISSLKKKVSVCVCMCLCVQGRMEKSYRIGYSNFLFEKLNSSYQKENYLWYLIKLSKLNFVHFIFCTLIYCLSNKQYLMAVWKTSDSYNSEIMF